MIKFLAALFGAFILSAIPAAAQSVTNPAPIAMVCAYNSVVPTPTSGQFFYVQCDSTGKVITTGGGGAGTVTVCASPVPVSGYNTYWTGATEICGRVGFSVVTDAQTGTTYTIPAADNSALVTLTNASATAVTLPQATGSFTTGWNTTICNLGAGLVTITPTTSTINGAATVALRLGDCIAVVSNGTNYSAVYTPGGGTFAGGTVTTSYPIISGTQTWNGSSGTVFLADNINVTTTPGTNSSRLSALIERQIGGSTYFRVGNAFSGYSAIWLGGGITPSVTNMTIYGTGGSTTVNAGQSNGAINFEFAANLDGLSINASNTNAVFANNYEVGWSSSNTGIGTIDTAFSRISAGLIGIGTGAAASTAGSLSMTGLTASGTAVIFSGIGSDTATTDTTACIKSSDGTLLKGTGTLGICLGTSSARYKSDIEDLTAGLPEIMALRAKSFYLDAQHGDPKKQMYGFLAEDCAKVLPKLTGLDDEARPNTCDYLGVVPVLVRAVQQQQAEIERLRERF